MNILAIIPARGGSKGLPNKNILPLLGHPLIAYSVKAAKDSAYINRVIVSTDSEKIAEVAKAYGAEIPFMRPDEYAQDLSTDLEVFQHALNWLKENEGYVPDYIVQLRPTSPVRQAQIIDRCIERMLRNPQADSLRIVTPSPITPYKMWALVDEEQPMHPLLTVDGVKEPYNEPRQRLPKTYWQIGTLDVIRPRIITEDYSMSGNVIMPHVVENLFAVDIDDLSGFQKAEEVISQNDCIKFDS
jgi:CMP-N,N'-diacetyllegionaminic acid synthase